MIDDVLGLVVLAVVAGIIRAADSPAAAENFSPVWETFVISMKALVFLTVALVVGSRLAPLLYRYAARLRGEGILISISLVFCFLMSYLSFALAGLAPIVGAFASGLIVEGESLKKYFRDGEKSIEELLFPLSKFFVPIFFVHMGFQVDLSTLADYNVILFGFAITVMAILGKQACGLAVVGRNNASVSKILVGIGMVPRGEVGLIFAMIGSKLVLDGKRIVDSGTYSAIILMVLLTTLLTPIAIKWSLARKEAQQQVRAGVQQKA